MNAESREQFINACRWYLKSVEADDATTAFMNLIIMIESFLPDDSDCCPKCGQSRYSVSKKFKDFLGYHLIPNNKRSGHEDQGIKQIANKLYNLRCSIAHGGAMLESHMTGTIIPDQVRKQRLLEDLYSLGSRLLVSLLLNRYRSEPRL